jgi:hypothetical protein
MSPFPPFLTFHIYYNIFFIKNQINPSDREGFILLIGYMVIILVGPAGIKCVIKACPFCFALFINLEIHDSITDIKNKGKATHRHCYPVTNEATINYAGQH